MTLDLPTQDTNEIMFFTLYGDKVHFLFSNMLSLSNHFCYFMYENIVQCTRKTYNPFKYSPN